MSISVKSPPVEGQANTSLLAFIAQLTGAKKSQVALKSGHKSRDKVSTLLLLNKDEVSLSIPHSEFGF